VGYGALQSVSFSGPGAGLSAPGSYNTAVGNAALNANTSATGNTAVGAQALPLDRTGGFNVAIGVQALPVETSGGANTAVGTQTMQLCDGCSNNIAIGNLAGSNLLFGSYNIDIGSTGAFFDGQVVNTGVIRIGGGGRQTSAFIAGIRGVTTGNSDAMPVLIDSNGQLGTANSSARLKEDIQDMGEASSNLLRLRPVTFRYKKPYDDGSKPLDYGLIAEEAAEVYPDLVVRDKDGEILSVQYQKLTPMLLNEVQKQNRHIQELQQQSETIRLLQEQVRQQGEANQSLQAQVAALQKTLDALLASGASSTSRGAAR
jgi:hypothetical protein